MTMYGKVFNFPTTSTINSNRTFLYWFDIYVVAPKLDFIIKYQPLLVETIKTLRKIDKEVIKHFHFYKYCFLFLFSYFIIIFLWR
jgi:hypothetical protein